MLNQKHNITILGARVAQHSFVFDYGLDNRGSISGRGKGFFF
jgi:hypothetical protein